MTVLSVTGMTMHILLLNTQTQGGVGDDSEAALYASDGYIYGHVEIISS